MSETRTYIISYGDMRKIVHNYYMKSSRNVRLIIKNEIDTDRFAGSVITTMQLVEESSIAGIKKRSIAYFSIDNLKEILSLLLLHEGKEVLSITDNAVVSTRIKGNGLGEYEEQTITGKSFKVVTKIKENQVSDYRDIRGKTYRR